MKVCYYKLLEVEQDSSFEEIKKSYRKLALKWHPDKNPHRVEEATTTFRTIQEAYDVLSDPQERAFYDRNREAFMRGAGADFDEGQIIDVMAYFDASIYSGYTDDLRGFYTIYRNLFEELAKQEDLHVDLTTDGSREPIRTTFGSSKSDASVVKDFYAFWSNFSTRMSFSWCDDYETIRAANRRVRRLMEKENRRSRETAKKEYSETIRELVKFMQKRDPRWKLISEEIKAANEMRAIIEQRKRAEEKLARNQAGLEFQEQDWMKVEDRSDGEEDEDEEYLLEELYCVACEKAFKSEKQFTNHEKSKKHLKNVELLKQVMLEDEEDGTITSNVEAKMESLDISVGEEDEDLISSPITRKKKKKSKKKVNLMGIFSADEHEDGCATDTPRPEQDFEVDGDKPSPEFHEDDQKKPKSEEKRKKNETKKKEEELLKCNVCLEEFSSRNKLFMHIKETDHAQAIPNNAKSSTSSKKSKKKK